MTCRKRSIRPEFFTDSDICELSPLHRLLFIGLWTQADKEGRLLNKPKELKIRILPFDKVDLRTLIDDLSKKGFLIKYKFKDSFKDLDLIFIPNFVKHQRPHPQETPSEFPGIEHRTDTLQNQVGSDSDSTPTQVGLNVPFFSYLISSTSSPVLAKPVLKSVGELVEGNLVSKRESPEDLQAAWNKYKAPEMPNWERSSKTRRDLAVRRLKERSITGPGGFIEVIQRMAKSSFCRGFCPPSNGRKKPFKADPDFLLQEDGPIKTLEGKYDDVEPLQQTVKKTETDAEVQARYPDLDLTRRSTQGLSEEEIRARYA